MKPTNKPPSVYLRLREKLGREPSNSELLDAGLQHAVKMKRQGMRRAERQHEIWLQRRSKVPNWGRT